MAISVFDVNACRACLGLLVVSAAFAWNGDADVYAQDSPDQQKARESYERFLATEKPVLPTSSARQLSGRALELREKFSAEPEMAEVQERLFGVQNARVPLSEPQAITNYAEILANVASANLPVAEFAQVLYWNNVALDLSALDHTPTLTETPTIPGTPLPAPTPPRVRPLDQVGPVRTARAMAIVHIAMFEALNSVTRTYPTYRGIQGKIFARSGLPSTIDAAAVSKRHAIAFAAFHTLYQLYPNQRATLTTFLLANTTVLVQIPQNQANAGILIGEAAADAIGRDRSNDGSELPDPPVSTVTTIDPDKWQRDPLNDDPNVALGRNWSLVRPFVIDRAESHRPAVPPRYLKPDNTVDPVYVLAFNEVLHKGGDPVAGLADPPGLSRRRPTPTTRTTVMSCGETIDEEFIGKFWAYDATALLCAPPRLYNMIATSLALNEKRSSFTNGLDVARYLALLNVAMADAGLAAWEAKYYYFYPRPVTAIRAAKVGMSPLAQEMPFWTPLGAPVSNARPGIVNFTPPFPAYPSGHATFGGAIFEVLRRYYGTDDGFKFTSDEYNGHNSDPGAPTPRPLRPLTFTSLTCAEQQNAQSRIFLGIHWQFDATAGITQGRAVAKDIMTRLYVASP